MSSKKYELKIRLYCSLNFPLALWQTFNFCRIADLTTLTSTLNLWEIFPYFPEHHSGYFQVEEVLLNLLVPLSSFWQELYTRL